MSPRERSCGRITAPCGLSRDGRLGAIVTKDGSVSVLELATGKGLFRKNVGTYLNGGAISPDNSRMATSTDVESGVWNLKTGEKRAKLPVIFGLKFSPDGKWLVGWSNAKPEAPVVLLDAQTGQEHDSFKHPNGLKNSDSYAMTTYGFTPDGRSLAVSWVNAGIMIYDLKNRKLARHFDIDANLVAFSPDSKVMVANKERVVMLMNVETGKEIRRWKLSDSILSGSYGTFSPDGKSLALGFEGGIQLWNPETGQRIDPFDEPITEPRWLTMTGDAQTFATLCGWSSIRLYDTQTLREKARLDVSPDSLSHLAFSPDGRRLAFVEQNYADPNKKPPRTRVLDVVSGKEIKARKMIDGELTHWNGNDAVVVMQGTWEQMYWVTVDVTTGQERDRKPIPADRADYQTIYDASLLIEPRFMVVDNIRRLDDGRERDRRKFIAEWPSGKRIRPLVFSDVGANGGHKDMTRSVYNLSPDGRLILTGENGEREMGPITLTETATGQARFQIKPKHEFELINASCSPDGRLIVISRWGKYTFVDSLTFEPLIEWAPKAGYGSSFAFSANGQIMVTGDTSAITVWDLKAALRPRKISPDKLSAADLAKLWIELENPDAHVGHRAMVTLYRRPDDAIGYLKTKLPASLTNRRLAVLADKLKVTDAVRIRWLRCVELLERIGTPPARAVLEQFRNVSDAETSADAVRSLDRLALMAR